VSYQQELANYYCNLVDSRLFDWLNVEYQTASQMITHGDFIGYYVDNKSAHTVTDNDIIQEIYNLIQAHTIPIPDDNTIFTVHFPKGISVLDANNNASCQIGSFCAYHSYFTIIATQQNIAYTVIPDQTSNGCQFGCGMTTNPDNTFVTSSHEVVETVTDAYGTWYDHATGDEIADLCNQDQGTILGRDGQNYKIQLEWSNAHSYCQDVDPNVAKVIVPPPTCAVCPLVTTFTVSNVGMAANCSLATPGQTCQLGCKAGFFCGGYQRRNRNMRENRCLCQDISNSNYSIYLSKLSIKLRFMRK